MMAAQTAVELLALARKAARAVLDDKQQRIADGVPAYLSIRYGGPLWFLVWEGSPLYAVWTRIPKDRYAGDVFRIVLTPENTASEETLVRALLESAIKVEPIPAEPSVCGLDLRFAHRAGGWALYLGTSRYDFSANLSEARTRAVFLDCLLATPEART